MKSLKNLLQSLGILALGSALLLIVWLLVDAILGPIG